ncbi:MAG: amidase [Alphaproteobacteria bacterium]|nr:amidase [Alphaproteobacteria bacterium]
MSVRPVAGSAVPEPPVAPLAPAFATDGLAVLPALEQARRIREGELTSVALVEHHLDRIARHDGELASLVQVWERSALRQARAADRARARGAALGPFHGVPTAVKDHHFVRGARVGFGSRAFSWAWSPVDDGVVRSLRAAGFVLLGKTAMSEIGLLPITETAVHPPTRCAWDPSRTAGGSSGGAGAAVAAGLVPVAPGTDGAGSVRIPAALNGLLGLKTTRGLIPLDADRIDVFGLSVVGPMARTVDDAAALLDALCLPRHAHHRARSRDPLPRLRIGVVRTAPFGTLDPRWLARVDAAAAVLRDAGHLVEEHPCPQGSVAEFTPLYQHFLGRVPVPFPSRLEPTVRWFWTEGRKVPRARAMEIFRSFEARGLQALDGVDLMLTPTTLGPPPEVGAYADLPPEAHFEAAAALGTYTALMNVTGQPALTVPFGTADGLPVGVQLVGHQGRDALLLAVARVLRGEGVDVEAS